MSLKSARHRVPVLMPRLRRSLELLVLRGTAIDAELPSIGEIDSGVALDRLSNDRTIIAVVVGKADVRH